MCAVPNMAVFCSSLTSWFPGMLLTYFLNDFEIIIIIIIIMGTWREGSFTGNPERYVKQLYQERCKNVL